MGRTMAQFAWNLQPPYRPALINLIYHGPAVDAGIMPIGLAADVLDGFAAGYRKTAAYIGSPDTIPDLHVATPSRGSIEWWVVAGLTMVSQAPGTLLTIENAWEFTKHVAHVVSGIIEVKKLLKGEAKYDVNVSGDNNVVLVGNKIEVPTTKEIFEVFQARLIDRDLQKIVRPLEGGQINEAELAIEGQTATVVKSEERQYFNPEPLETTTKSEELVGTLVSTNKEYKRGTFRMQNGRTIPYHFVGHSDEEFLREFSYKGEVRVMGDVTTDESGRPVHLAVRSVERLQPTIPFTPPIDE